MDHQSYRNKYIDRVVTAVNAATPGSYAEVE
jgi:hypothetical protein